MGEGKKTAELLICYKFFGQVRLIHAVTCMFGQKREWDYKQGPQLDSYLEKALNFAVGLVVKLANDR